MAFDLDSFVEACRAAARGDSPRAAAEEEVRRLLAQPGVADVLAGERTTHRVVHADPELTVLHLVLPPGVRSVPHDHAMWAAVGVVAGREDNSFFERADGGLRAAGGRTVAAGDVLGLRADAIHAIENPTSGYTAAIHVYGGDLLGTPRRAWGPEGEVPMDERFNVRIAEAARAREDALGRPLRATDVAELLATATAGGS